jgi:hypothetical protein
MMDRARLAVGTKYGACQASGHANDQPSGNPESEHARGHLAPISRGDDDEACGDTRHAQQQAESNPKRGARRFEGAAQAPPQSAEMKQAKQTATQGGEHQFE